MALTHWSIDKLARHLLEQQIAQLSPTALRALPLLEAHAVVEVEAGLRLGRGNRPPPSD